MNAYLIYAQAISNLKIIIRNYEYFERFNEFPVFINKISGGRGKEDLNILIETLNKSKNKINKNHSVEMDDDLAYIIYIHKNILYLINQEDWNSVFSRDRNYECFLKKKNYFK